MKQLTRIVPILLLVLSACSDVEDGADGHDGHHHHDHELITTVILNFAAVEGDDVSATATADTFAGGVIADDIVLSNATDYILTFEILNEEETPAEKVHVEIADEDDEHQLFFQGTAVRGPANDNENAIVEQIYVDFDVNDRPVGLENEINTIEPGSGDFKVTLRHMPLQNGETIKTDNTAADVAEGGLGAIGGDNDFSIEFSLTVE